MSVIFLLIPLSILLGACFLGGFIWAVRSGQYEDTCTPSMRLLLDEPGAKPDQNPIRSNPGKVTATHPNQE